MPIHHSLVSALPSIAVALLLCFGPAIASADVVLPAPVSESEAVGVSGGTFLSPVADVAPGGCAASGSASSAAGAAGSLLIAGLVAGVLVFRRRE